MSDVTPEVEPKDLTDLLERYPGASKANTMVRAALRIGFQRGVNSELKRQISDAKRELKRMMEVKS